jgi:hypothetical protein
VVSCRVADVIPRARFLEEGCKAATEALTPVSGTYAQPGADIDLVFATSLTPKFIMVID